VEGFVVKEVFYGRIVCHFASDNSSSVACAAELEAALDYSYPIFKNPVRTSKRTPQLTITDTNWLTLFKEIIAV
jgi:hypothetical protein